MYKTFSGSRGDRFPTTSVGTAWRLFRRKAHRQDIRRVPSRDRRSQCTPGTDRPMRLIFVTAGQRAVFQTSCSGPRQIVFPYLAETLLYCIRRTRDTWYNIVIRLRRHWSDAYMSVVCWSKPFMATEKSVSPAGPRQNELILKAAWLRNQWANSRVRWAEEQWNTKLPFNGKECCGKMVKWLKEQPNSPTDLEVHVKIILTARVVLC